MRIAGRAIAETCRVSSLQFAVHLLLGGRPAFTVKPKAWMSYVPAILISVSGLAIAGAIGGPIAAAIAAFVAAPSFIAASVLTFVVRIKYKPSTTPAALGLGLGLYLGSMLVVLAYLYLFGPSQIM
jgi:hypothetical protein